MAEAFIVYTSRLIFSGNRQSRTKTDELTGRVEDLLETLTHKRKLAR